MMLVWFALVFLFLALYPFTFYPLSILFALRISGKREPGAGDLASPPSMSIVFCAHNEERSIARKLDNCLAAMAAYRGRCELLIYLDNCTDSTEQVLRGQPGIIRGDERIQVIANPKRSGKSHGMNRLLEAAQGELVVFTDANVTLDEECLSVAAKSFADPEVGCVCSNLTYTNPNESSTAQAGSMYWRFEEWLKQVESDLGSTVGADGSLFALRRRLFRPVPDDIIDDMFTTYGAFIQGYRVIRVPQFRAFEKHTVVERDEFRRKVRIACRALNCMRILSSEFGKIGWTTLYMILAHKIMRYFTSFFLVVGVACLVAGLALLHHFIAIGALFAAALGSYILAQREVRPFTTVYSILGAVTAVGLGVVASMRGERYQTWAIPNSSRKP